MAEPTNKVIRKGDIVDAISRDAGIGKRQANKALTTALDCITENLVENKSVILTGFGTFKPTLQPERTVRVPKGFGGAVSSDETKVIPEHRRVSFKAGKTLADAVR